MNTKILINDFGILYEYPPYYKTLFLGVTHQNNELKSIFDLPEE